MQIIYFLIASKNIYFDHRVQVIFLFPHGHP